MIRRLHAWFDPLPSTRRVRPPSGRLPWAAAFLTLASAASAFADGASPYRGLWVGEVTLRFVNEVPVPLDKNNVPIAPDPMVPTPTADKANLRLILHVNGAGQVSLLRDVAILDRSGSTSPGAGGAGTVNLRDNPAVLGAMGSPLSRESDLALVTDERLYGEFPPQPAQRIASAVFDFGDGRATEAVEAVIDAAAKKAAQRVLAGDASTAAVSSATAAGQAVIDGADVAEAFRQFRETYLSRAKVDQIAVGGPSDPVLLAARTAAQALLTRTSFFPDPRGVAMVDAIVAAANAAGTNADARKAAAQVAAAAGADLTDDYQRFLAGKTVGDMVAGAADAAAVAAVAPGATAASITLAVNGNAAVRAARSEATGLDAVSAYRDSRATSAVDVVVAAVIASAAGALPAEAGTDAAIRSAAAAAGSQALATDVARFGVPVGGPTPDYNAFLDSTTLAGVPAKAGAAAVKAMIEKRADNPFLSEAELASLARDAATDEVRAGSPNAFGEAAMAARRELPLAGEFRPGAGDPRFTFVIKKEGQASLGAAALEGTILLPASHPTNPFRHFRHPDHRYGFNITRRVRLDFDAGPPELKRSGYGVDRIAGVYREEIFGLHKPLGPAKNAGLRVEGRFELSRVALIDALNAR